MTSESQDFEYDTEDNEASDEAFEAADEGADEASDEANDEAFEAADEGSDEASDEAADEASDEAFEAADEGSDEASDEGTDEAYVPISARYRADQDRRRREIWAARIAADRRREAQRATATQQSINNRIRDIRGSGRPRTFGISPLHGARVVTLRLRNGRQTQVQVSPALASAGEVNKLRAVMNANDRRRAVADAANSRAISSLAAAQTGTVKRLTDQQVKSDQALGKRIVEGDNRLDKRISTELVAQKGAIEKHNKRIFRRIRQLRKRALWNNVLLASAFPLFAAYGDRSSPFSRTNLILTGSLAGWMVGDEIIDQFMGRGKYGKAWSGAADTWSYLAPIGNAVTDFLLFRNKQHERFVTGFANGITGTGPTSVTVPVAKDFDLTAVTPAPAAVATIVSDSNTAARAVTASVNSVTGKLDLSFDPPIAGNELVKVAWMVDTQSPATVPA